MDTDHFYLTNGCCENAGFVGASQMQRLGLDFGEYDGFFYPLTDAEARYVATDQVAIGDCGVGAWLGFSMLYRHRKWLAPVIEIGEKRACSANEDAPARACALQAKHIYAQVKERVGEVGGHAFMVEAAGRFWIEVMLPFALAMTHGDFASWKRFLEQEFFAGIHTDARQAESAVPVRPSAGVAA